MEVCFFSYLNCFLWLRQYYLLHLFNSNCFAALWSLWGYRFFIWIYEFLKNLPQRTFFYNVNLESLKNILQRNLRTDKTSAFLKHLEAQTLKIFLFCANHGGAFMHSLQRGQTSLPYLFRNPPLLVTHPFLQFR